MAVDGSRRTDPTRGFKSKTILLSLPDQAGESFSKRAGKASGSVAGGDMDAGDALALKLPDVPASAPASVDRTAP
jgi:hypothetical protein